MGETVEITRDSDSVWGVELRHLMAHPTSTDWLIVLWVVCGGTSVLRTSN